MNLVKEFFVYDETAAIYLDEEIFERNKETFFLLIFPETSCKFEFTDFHVILKEIFSDRKWGKVKLEKFFFNEAIFTLWTKKYLGEQEGFITSEYMRTLNIIFSYP